MNIETAQYSVHTDHQGSVRAITDAGGIVINSYAYDAYGNAEEAVEGLAQRFRYTGREWDEVTGLYHYRARAYVDGRFLQEDPLHFEALHPKRREQIDEKFANDKRLMGIASVYAAELNTYRYVSNNPMMFVDPSGKFGFGLYTSAVKRAVAVGSFAKRIGAGAYDLTLKMFIRAERQIGREGIQNTGGCVESFEKGFGASTGGASKVFKPNAKVDLICYGIGQDIKQLLNLGGQG